MKMSEKPKKKLSGDYAQAVAQMNEALRVSASFDVICRPVRVAGRPASLYLIDGFVKDDLMEKILQFFMGLKAEALEGIAETKAFADTFIPYVEVDAQDDVEQLTTQVLSGSLALLVEGLPQAILIDARTYPARDVSEPEDDRVLRGAHVGFVETLVFNTALIRRHIRDPRLTMEILQIGTKSKTDVVVCYMQGIVNQKQLEDLKKKLQSITIHALGMAQESLVECLLPKQQWYNPFPKVRYTERPDCAAANVLEGRIAIIVDNTPAVMLLPTSIFDFVQDTNDFYFPPLVGTYLRLIRTLVFLCSLFLTPIWYLLLENPDWVPDWLPFISIAEPNAVPVIAQLLVIELIVDGVKLASLNTPNVLNNAFGLVGTLILGEFAVKAGLFVPEVLLYMAFVSVANFTQPSFELGYAFKLFRMLFLILTALFNLWGFGAGVLLMLILLATTRTVSGRSYLAPLIPFHGGSLLRLIFRRPISDENS